MKTTFFYIPSINDRTKYITLYAGTIEEFMKHNPPCKRCLVQPICVELDGNIKIKACNKLRKFMDNSKFFY